MQGITNFNRFKNTKAVQENRSSIQNQEAHHKKQTFRDEYLEFLKKFKIEYGEKYIFMNLSEYGPGLRLFIPQVTAATD